ncbi:MAG: hypothetical protein IJ997_02390 [Mycoplasmataceae bacterium]|nr:hypothetical protein [Mycoplasmataceae bacterium]
MSKFSKKEIKQKIDNNYQEITDFKEEMISDKKQKILKLTIKGTMKKEQNQNEYKPKNQFEALVINQFTNINNRLDNIEQDVSELKQEVSILKEDVNELKQEVSILKEDVNELKQDVSILKEDVNELKQDVSILKQDVSELKQDVNKIKNTPTMKKELLS